MGVFGLVREASVGEESSVRGGRDMGKVAY